MLVPTTASAHAELSGTTPASESTIEDHPRVVTLTFTENVTVAFGAIKAYGPDGSCVNRGEATADGDEVTIPIEAEHAGTYAIAWRVTSADGHPVRGAFVFHLERASEDSASLDEARAASEGSRARDIAFGIARGALLLGVLAAVGGVIFSVISSGAWQPRWLRASLLLALVSAVAAYVLDASIAAGLSITESLDEAVVREQASTVYGRASVFRIGVALVCIAATLLVRSTHWHRSAIRVAVLVPFVALAATLSLSGHAVGEDVTALRLPLDMLHSLAAAAWIGGLVQLVPWSRATPVDPRIVERYSRLAFASVVVLVLTGMWASWEEIGLSFDALTDTRYGWIVIAKVALLAATLPIANRNRARTVPAIRSGVDGAAGVLRRYVRFELAILVLVVAATAWLIQTPPAKVQVAPAFVEQTKQLGSGGSIQLVVDPAAVGTNEAHVYVFTKDTQPDAGVSELTFTAYNDKRGLGPLDLDLPSAGPGHFATNRATFPFDGTWRLEASLRRGRFDEERTRFSVKITSQQNQE